MYYIEKNIMCQLNFACIPANPFRWILSIIFLKNPIKVGRMFFHSKWPVEEFFGCDRKKFSFIGGSVGAEK